MVVFFMVAGLCEVAGLVVLAIELTDARRRLRGLAEHEPVEVVDERSRLEQAMPITARGGSQTVEARLWALEHMLESHRQGHPDMELELWRHAKREARAQGRMVAARLGPEIDALLSYVLGEGDRRKFMPWLLGPALLFGGVVLGSLANILSVAG
jgi:hypothetical protein